MDLTYAPKPDGRPDPGEVVWTWVPYEDDPQQGKDRPVLVVGRDGTRLVGLMLTSKDHDRDAEQEARAGRFWYDLGSGPWDSQGRPSEVRLNRLIEVDPEDVRREGAVLDETRYDAVLAEAAPYLPQQDSDRRPEPGTPAGADRRPEPGTPAGADRRPEPGTPAG